MVETKNFISMDVFTFICLIVQICCFLFCLYVYTVDKRIIRSANDSEKPEKLEEPVDETPVRIHRVGFDKYGRAYQLPFEDELKEGEK